MPAPLAPDEVPVFVPFGERAVEPPRPVTWREDSNKPVRVGLLLAWRRQKYPDRRIYWEGLILTGRRDLYGHEAIFRWVLGYKIKPYG